MKATITPTTDSANSYPPECEIEPSQHDGRVIIHLHNPERDVAFDTAELLDAVRFVARLERRDD